MIPEGGFFCVVGLGREGELLLHQFCAAVPSLAALFPDFVVAVLELVKDKGIELGGIHPALFVQYPPLGKILPRTKALGKGKGVLPCLETLQLNEIEFLRFRRREADNAAESQDQHKDAEGNAVDGKHRHGFLLQEGDELLHHKQRHHKAHHKSHD